MKTIILILTVGLMFFGLNSFALAQDSGIPDTLYFVCHDPIKLTPPPWEVHFSLLVTNDVPQPVDSITVFQIPIMFSHTNPAAYCSLTSRLNTVYPYSDTINNIFRHFGGKRNRIMDMYENDGRGWGCTAFNPSSNVNPDWFSLQAICCGTTDGQDQAWGEGSKILLATFTFQIQDTMTITFDTIDVWGWLHLDFLRKDAISWVPQHSFPYSVVQIRQVQRGDANLDGVIDVGDIVYLINHLFKNGPAPNPLEAGDAYCDGIINISDIILLIGYLYKDGPPPNCP